jgi:hypothetical protein
MRKISLIILLLSTSLSFAQESDMAIHENELSSLLEELRSSENNEQKEEKNSVFKAKMESVLSKPGAFDYDFPKLSTVGFIDSPDDQLRIVNWNVEQDDMSHKYYCYVMHYDKKDKLYRVTELKDNTFGMPSQPSGILTADQWYGALYYRIIPVKKGSKTIYTVIGWDYNTTLSQIKLVDAIYVSGKSVKLGSPIFKMGRETKKRVFFEHSKKATMYLNYEDDRKRIMMDHLSPESPSMKNFRSFYVPDLSYDAFVFKKNKWILYEDVIGVNPEAGQKKQVVYVKNEKTGKLERKVIKTKWENPEDAEAPAGGTEHVAVTPESAKELEEKAKENEPKVDKKDKRDASELSTIKGKKKRKRRRRR